MNKNDFLFERIRHGSPYDRGSSDSYYGFKYFPHYFVGATHQSEEISGDRLCDRARAEYQAGWDDNKKEGYHKVF